MQIVDGETIALCINCKKNTQPIKLKNMNKAFKFCVDLLVYLAAKCHMTYEEINIWIFVIIGPIVFLILIWIIYRQHLMINSLKLSSVA